MNCQVTQRRLLGADDNAGPTSELQVHLDECASCREWQSRLLQMERNIAFLPVPPSTSRAAFVAQLLHPAVSISQNSLASQVCASDAPMIEKPRLNGSATFRRSAWRTSPISKVRLAGWASAGLAAAIMLSVFGRWVWKDVPEPVAPQVKRKAVHVPDPLIAKLMKRSWAIAEADSLLERASMMAKMATDLQGESQLLSAAEKHDKPDPSDAKQPLADAATIAQDFVKLHTRMTDALARNGQSSLVIASLEKPAASVDRKRIRQLQRNSYLIHEIVDGAIRLLDERNPVKRADACNGLALRLAGEIRLALMGKDGGRAAEMGEYLNDLLQRGVAKNLRAARHNSDTIASAEDLSRVHDWVADLLQPIQDQIEMSQGADPEAMNRTLEAIRSGRLAVELSLRS